MNEIITILRKIIFNQKVGTMVVIFVSGLIQKKINTMKNTPETTDPLWLPRGTVRALFALILLATSIADFIMPSWTLPDEYHIMTIAVVAYYLGYRSDNAKIKEIKI